MQKLSYAFKSQYCFDMDGVIVDTEPLHRKAYFQTFKDLNITVSEEFYTSLTGTSTKNLLR